MTIQYLESGDLAIFDNLSFRRDKKTGYFLNAKTHKRLHVYVWEYHKGKIPPGYEVHHKDFDKNNNDISNLQLLTKSEHTRLHGKSWTKERYNKQIEMLKEKAVPKASEWHKSDEGKDWHKEHYESMKNKLHKQSTFTCLMCGKSFIGQDTGQNKFCSNACRANYRRKSGVDNETRKCEYCGKEFITNKYSKARTCSRSCRNKIRWDKVDPKGRKS